MNAHASGVILAMVAAVLFGATTPLIAWLGDGLGAFGTACLLYVGAALGVLLARAAGVVRGLSGHALRSRDLGTIVGMAVCGAAIAPVLLVLGLARTTTVAASLALNGEVLFTIVLAVVFFREPWRGRVLTGIVAILLGGVLLTVDQNRGNDAAGGVEGLLLVLAATLFWGIDNTLSRNVSEASPLSVVAAKGALGSLITLPLALAFGEHLPGLGAALGLMAIGATGYGASLVVYLLAQRRLGAARTGSIFGLAPFIGAALALAAGERDAGWLTALGAACFGLGVWFHAREPHAHAHMHEPLEHEHGHRHDDGHHDHQHEVAVVGSHSHPHSHAQVEHTHAHAPDLHHRHRH